MVKKLIKGLLGKKGEKSAGKEEKDSEEVPDELPALAEDTLKKEETKEEKPASKEEKGTEEVSDELPPLEEKQPKEEEKSTEKKEEPAKEEEEDDLLKEFREYKEEYKEKGEKGEVGEKRLEEKKEGKEIEEEAVEEKKEIKKPITEEAKPEEEKGFFSEVLAITKKQGINESILKQDLSKKMKDYWYFHSHEKEKFKNKEKLQQDLLDELHQLKRLEERWIAQKKFIEEDKRILLEKERDIKTKTEELQKILKQLEFYKDVPHDKHFWLNNGMVAKNIYELMNLVEVIDDKTFHHHTHSKKNDFGLWIKDAVRNEELAKKVNAAKTREEILVILENASMGNIYGIYPEKYFRMNNGRVIKDIKELILALKGVNERVFESHVNNKRNDFSFWIRDVFKNDYLADKLQTTKSKEDMIKILEDFFKV